MIVDMLLWGVCDSNVAETPESTSTRAVGVTLCIDPITIDHLSGVLRHLVVGLVDQSIQVRLLSEDSRIQSLKLEPVQALVHPHLTWPTAKWRITRILEQLSHQLPTVVHALSAASHQLAESIATSFEADLVVGVTSQSCVESAAKMDATRVDRWVALSRPLASALAERIHVPADRIELIRPGVLAGQHVSCFSRPGRTPTLLCTAAFERSTGLADVIEATRILKARGRTFMLFLLGQGRAESELRALVRDRQVNSFITFAHLFGSSAQAMAGADIFIQPNVETYLTEESLQSMAEGLAVVTYPTPCCDHYRHEETALVCDKPAAESLAAAIERLLCDPSFAQRIAAGGQEYVRTHHSMTSMAELAAAMYREFSFAHETFPLKKE